MHANPHWYTIYPMEHYIAPEKTRSIIFLNKHIATDLWTQVDFASLYVSTVQVQMAAGKLLIINTYNHCTNTNAIDCVLSVMQTRGGTRNTVGVKHIIWLGDFNRHHPMWDEDHNAHLFMRTNLDGAQHLINVVIELNLKMALPKDLLTLCAMVSGNHMRPDNVFMSALPHSSIIKCMTILEERPARTDHLPIVTMVNLAPEMWTETLKPNYRKENWEEFRETLVSRLGGLEAKEEI